MSLLPDLLVIALWIPACVILAEALCALIHWWEDRYANPAWPLIGPHIAAPNLLHHDEPRAFLAHGWWRANDLQLIVAGAVVGGAALCGLWSWQLTLVAVLAANANSVHQWAHRSRAENGRLISWLQDARLIQSRAQHGRHHGGTRTTAYATLTPWLNPVLDGLRIWRGLEWVVALLTGIRPRAEGGPGQRRIAGAVALLLVVMTASGCSRTRFVTHDEFRRVTDSPDQHPNGGLRGLSSCGAAAGGIAGAAVNVPLLPLTLMASSDHNEHDYFGGIKTVLAPTYGGIHLGRYAAAVAAAPLFAWWTSKEQATRQSSTHGSSGQEPSGSITPHRTRYRS